MSVFALLVTLLATFNSFLAILANFKITCLKIRKIDALVELFCIWVKHPVVDVYLKWKSLELIHNAVDLRMELNGCR